MEIVKSTSALQALNKTLARMYSQETVAAVLGITQPMADEFWKIQNYTVMQRFYSYVLTQLRWSPSLERSELSEAQATIVDENAKRLLEAGLTYGTVRDWWRHVGDFAHDSAFKAKHEAADLRTRCLQVLCFFEKGRPLWLTFDASGKSGFTEQQADGYAFDVTSVTQLGEEHLQWAATKFAATTKELGVTRVKVVPSRKTTTN